MPSCNYNCDCNCSNCISSEYYELREAEKSLALKRELIELQERELKKLRKLQTSLIIDNETKEGCSSFYLRLKEANIGETVTAYRVDENSNYSFGDVLNIVNKEGYAFEYIGGDFDNYLIFKRIK